MGKVFARLIYTNNYVGIDTGYSSISDVPPKWQAATLDGWDYLYGNIPMVPAA